MAALDQIIDRFANAGNAAETAYAVLREAIVTNALKPGTRLRADDLAKRLGVSKTPVREALRKLQAEELITLQPGNASGTADYKLSEALIRAVVLDTSHGIPAAIISRRFHTTMVELIASVCDHIRRSMQLEAVVLSGGVFMNALLSSDVHTRLTRDGFRVYRHRRVPPNDGGISLGQLAIAAALAQRASAGENRD